MALRRIPIFTIRRAFSNLFSHYSLFCIPMDTCHDDGIFLFSENRFSENPSYLDAHVVFNSPPCFVLLVRFLRVHDEFQSLRTFRQQGMGCLDYAV